MSRIYDAVILGGGMVGASIACGLSQNGFDVALVDPQEPSSYNPDMPPAIRVSALSFASEQVLKNLGAWDFLESKRMCCYRRLAVNEMHVKKGLFARLPDISRWARTEFSAQEIGQEHLGHIVENDLVQFSLHERLEQLGNVDLYIPNHAQSLLELESHHELSLNDGQKLRTRLIVGAEGANSPLRQMAGIGQYKEQYDQQAFVACVSYEGQQEDITWQSFTSHGPLAFLPLPDIGSNHYASLVWYDRSEQIQTLKQLSPAALLGTIQSTFPEELPPLLRVEKTASFPLFKSHAHDYVKPGIALAGDAAHTINPLAGQGVNLGFLDAAVLIETLAKARLNDEDFRSVEVLSRYQKARKPANQMMMSLMDVFYYGFGNQHAPVRIARNLGLGIAQRAGFAKNKVVKYATGLSGDLPRLARPA